MIRTKYWGCSWFWIFIKLCTFVNIKQGVGWLTLSTNWPVMSLFLKPTDQVPLTVQQTFLLTGIRDQALKIDQFFHLLSNMGQCHKYMTPVASMDWVMLSNVWRQAVSKHCALSIYIFIKVVKNELNDTVFTGCIHDSN